MLRFPLDEMAACQNFDYHFLTWKGPYDAGPQRVFVPVEGATDVMYWGMTLSALVCRWPAIGYLTMRTASQPTNSAPQVALLMHASVSPITSPVSCWR